MDITKDKKALALVVFVYLLIILLCGFSVNLWRIIMVNPYPGSDLIWDSGPQLTCISVAPGIGEYKFWWVRTFNTIDSAKEVNQWQIQKQLYNLEEDSPIRITGRREVASFYDIYGNITPYQTISINDYHPTEINIVTRSVFNAPNWSPICRK